MSVRALRTELGKLRQQVDRSMPEPTEDLFAEIERTARVFHLLHLGEPIPPELCSPAKVAELTEWHRRFNEMRVEADGETDQEGR